MIQKPPLDWFESNVVVAQKPQPNPYAQKTVSQSAGRQDVKSGIFRLILTILIGFPFILIGGTLLFSHVAIMMFIGFAVLIWSGYFWLNSIRSLFSGGVVFYFDEAGITVPGLLSRTFIGWGDVKGFSAKTINTYAYGFTKIASDHILYVERHMGKKIKLPTRHTGINLGGIRNLVSRMELQRLMPQNKTPHFSYDAPPHQPYTPTPRQDMPAAPEPSFVSFGKAAPISNSGFAARPSAPSPATFGRRPAGFVSKA